MATYHLRIAIDVPTAAADQLRADHDLPADAPVLDAVRQEVWQALAGAGAETGRWEGVRVT